MTPVYEYRCNGCDTRIETERVFKGTVRHLKNSKTVCGTVVRVWNANFNKVPGGNRV